MNEGQQFQEKDRVVIFGGNMKGTTGRLRRKFGFDEKKWIVDYDGYASGDPNGHGLHSPHELQFVQ